jgi:ABC-type proline/glycine betaine transport system ATPase subunit
MADKIYNLIKIYDDGETRDWGYSKLIISTPAPDLIIDYISENELSLNHVQIFVQTRNLVNKKFLLVNTESLGEFLENQKNSRKTRKSKKQRTN